MKQAIEENYILDVLRATTSYFTRGKARHRGR